MLIVLRNGQGALIVDCDAWRSGPTIYFVGLQYLLRLGKIGSDRIRQVQIGSDRFRQDQIGSDRIRQDQKGSDQKGSDRIKKDQIGSEIRQGQRSDRIRQDQIGSNWIKLGQITSDRIRLDDLASDRSRQDHQIASDRSYMKNKLSKINSLFIRYLRYFISFSLVFFHPFEKTPCYLQVMN